MWSVWMRRPLLIESATWCSEWSSPPQLAGCRWDCWSPHLRTRTCWRRCWLCYVAGQVSANQPLQQEGWWQDWSHLVHDRWTDDASAEINSLRLILHLLLILIPVSQSQVSQQLASRKDLEDIRPASTIQNMLVIQCWAHTSGISRRITSTTIWNGASTGKTSPTPMSQEFADFALVRNMKSCLILDNQHWIRGQNFIHIVDTRKWICSQRLRLDSS